MSNTTTFYIRLGYQSLLVPSSATPCHLAPQCHLMPPSSIEHQSMPLFHSILQLCQSITRQKHYLSTRDVNHLSSIIVLQRDSQSLPFFCIWTAYPVICHFIFWMQILELWETRQKPSIESQMIETVFHSLDAKKKRASRWIVWAGWMDEGFYRGHTWMGHDGRDKGAKSLFSPPNSVLRFICEGCCYRQSVKQKWGY